MILQSKASVSIVNREDGTGLIRIVRVESPKQPDGSVVWRVTKKSLSDCVLLENEELKAGVVPVLVDEINPFESLIFHV